LLKIALSISVVWVIAQTTLIACFWGYPQESDGGAYISMAQNCFNNGQWYPMAEDVYSTWIWAPGFINYLILQLRIFGVVNFNSISNLLLNIAMLLEIYYLGNKFFSKRTGLISVIIFCLLCSNSMVVLNANTEIVFLFLSLSALCLVFSGKWKYVVTAALLFAFANWIRPLAIIFLFASMLYFFIAKAKICNYIALIIPYVLFLFIIGTITEKKIGYFAYQSSTMGFNLLMTSNDNAKGNYYALGQDSVSFIENENSVTFAEKDSIWRTRALEWIKKHPAKTVVLFFIKIPILYLHDAWAYPTHWGINTTSANLFSDNATSKNAFIKKLLMQILSSIPFYLTFLLFFYALWVNRRNYFTIKSIFPAIFIIGTFATCVFIGSPRYHYPFMFAVIIYAAWGLDTLIKRKLLYGDKTSSP
jgi:hypothetical protein